MSTKRPPQCCWNCKFSVWPANRAGSRDSNRNGTCIAVVSPLPASFDDLWQGSPNRSRVYDVQGQECPVFEKYVKVTK